MTADEKRHYLKGKGWKRQDRSAHGEHCELWVEPGLAKTGWAPPGVSLAWAYRKQRRRDQGGD